jgi:hypothetical protein
MAAIFTPCYYDLPSGAYHLISFSSNVLFGGNPATLGFIMNRLATKRYGCTTVQAGR